MDALIMIAVLVGVGLLGAGAALFCEAVDALHTRYIYWSLRREKARLIAEIKFLKEEMGEEERFGCMGRMGFECNDPDCVYCKWDEIEAL